MSLLPAAFRNTDPMPMALGAKIEAPSASKPADPIAAFEKGDHLPQGITLGVDTAGGWDEVAVFTTKGWAAVDAYVRQMTKSMALELMDRHIGLFGGVKPVLELSDRELTERNAAFSAKVAEYARQINAGERVPFDHPSRQAAVDAMTKYHEIKHRDDPSACKLAENRGLPKIPEMNVRQMEELTAIVNWQIVAVESRLRKNMTQVPGWIGTVSPRQDAIAAKTAEIMRQKQELRAMSRYTKS